MVTAIQPEGNDGQTLRKASSLHCMEALRGRSSIRRSALTGSASVAAKVNRSASLGRNRTSKQKMIASISLVESRLNCGYGQSNLQGASVRDIHETRGWAVGRLSIMLLLFVTFTDVTFTIVNDQMSQIEAHEDYDALSPDVIRPAFLYKSATNVDRPSLGLGSAALSSITNALSPILPFTGGVDLRRSEYYSSGSVFQNVYAILEKTYEAYADARLDDARTSSVDNDESSKPTNARSLQKVRRKHRLTLGASDCFVSLDSIAELTLEDVSVIFEYVILSVKDGFKPARFQNKSFPRVKKVLQAIDNAVAKSRGEGVSLQKIPPGDNHLDHMDAFLFCAAMRVFAEWRLKRQTPDGYKGYAVGMSLGQKDIVQNVAKIERAAQAWIDSHTGLGGEQKSPSLRDVLQYEIDIGEHTSLPRLKESSGAMGLLWTRRQASYQNFIFENILEVPHKYLTSKDAVSAAYKEVYDQYHGWAVQKIFMYSFQASPPVEVIYKFMNPHRLAEVKEMASSLHTALAEENEVTGPSATGSLHRPLNEIAVPPENPLHRIGWETERIVNGLIRNLQKIGSKPDEKECPKSGLAGAELEEFITVEMSKNVHEHIESYLVVVKPLLHSLERLIQDMNMDDPTRV